MHYYIFCGCGGTADALVSGSSVERRVGSNPVIRTNDRDFLGHFYLCGFSGAEPTSEANERIELALRRCRGGKFGFDKLSPLAFVRTLRAAVQVDRHPHPEACSRFSLVEKSRQV